MILLSKSHNSDLLPLLYYFQGLLREPSQSMKMKWRGALENGTPQIKTLRKY